MTMEEVCGCSREEIVERVDAFYYSPEHMRAAPLSGAQMGVAQLKKDHELHIITARSEHMRERTEQWLTEHFPHTFTSIHFTNHHSPHPISKRSKAEICNMLGINLFIDDSLNHTRLIAERGIPVLLFNAPWNQTLISNKHITRVRAWDEVVTAIQKQIINTTKTS